MKLIFLLFLLFGNSYAQQLNKFDAKTEANKNVQRSLKTIKDYDDFVATMKKAINMGDYSAAIYLGALYMQDMSLQDGVKKAQPEMAKKYLRLALSKGYGLAAFYLSQLEDKDQTIIDVKIALHMPKTTQKIRELLAIRYAEIILNNEKFYSNQEAVKMAIDDIFPISSKTDNPILDFQVAHLLYLDKKLDLANKYINSACNNPKANTQLLALCLNDPYLNKTDKNGKQIKNKQLPNFSKNLFDSSGFDINKSSSNGK